MKKVARAESLIQVPCLKRESVAVRRSLWPRRKHTPLLLLNLIRFELFPDQVRDLIRHDGGQEDLGDRTSKALIKAHLEHTSEIKCSRDVNGGTDMRRYRFRACSWSRVSRVGCR